MKSESKQMNGKIELEIVILCNKNDLFLTKLCVTSIRKFYPKINIYLVKDDLNGRFNTADLENYYSVQLMDLGLRNYGWCTGKISLLLANQYVGRKFLLLDSDIIFIGRVLDNIYPILNDADFIVSPELGNDSNTDWFRRTYYDMNFAKQLYPDHIYPNFTFNCGQMVVSPGIFTKRELIKFIELEKYPYWTELSEKHLPCRDQSLFNILFPLKSKRGEIRLREVEFQVWSEAKKVVDNFDLKIVQNKGYPFLIHWAGATRIPYLRKMTRYDILYYFQYEYYSRLPFGLIKFHINNIQSFINYQFRKYFTQLLKSFKK